MNGTMLVVDGPRLERSMTEAVNKGNVSENLSHRALDPSVLNCLVNELAVYSVTDVEGVILEVSDSFCVATGYERDGLLGKTHRLISSGVHGVEFWKTFWECLQVGETWKGALCNRRRSGDLFWVNANVSPVLDEQGRICRFVSLMSEVSQRGSWNGEILDQERFWKAIDRSGLGMAVIGMDDRCWEANETFCRLLGYPKEKLLRMMTRDITYAEDFDKDRVLRERCLRGKENRFQLMKRFVSRRGEIVWANVSMSLVRGDDGKPRCYLSVIEDMTQRVELERELLSARNRLSLATQAAGVGIWDWNLVEDVLSWDEQMFVLYGMERERFLGRGLDWKRTLHPEDRTAAADLLRQALSGKAELDAEFRIVRGDGDVRTLRVVGMVQRDAVGNAIRMVGTNWDITEIRQQRECLEVLATEANQASRSKSQFLANMSHEIRTPMNGIIGLVSLLLDADSLSESHRMHAELIKSSAESLLTLINDILDFSKVESGKLEIERLDFDLRETLYQFSSLLRERAKAKELQFACVSQPEVPNALIGDAGRLRQVLLNLAGNAIKFTDVGRVVVETRLVEESERDAVLKFLVRDSGIGISESVKGRLFEKFTQGDASTSRLYGGSGLGLAISKELVELMGGEIGVESRLGEGSTFWFTVRLEKQDSKRLRKERIERLKGHKILVVDDDPLTRSLLEDQLREWKAEPVLFEDGPSALRYLYTNEKSKKPVSCAIVDFSMPNMNGLALAKTLRADPKLRELRMVLLTGLDRMEATKSIREYGFDAYCTKPFRPSELFNSIIRSLLPKGLGVSDERTRMLERFRNSEVRLLLAEDNVVNQLVMKGIFQRFGLNADVVANGNEALRAWSSGQYDLVLMDVQMPEMDGMEATREIRKKEAELGVGDVPIVAMTAFARPEDRDECLGAGMNDHITKPIDPDVLADVLNRLLPQDLAQKSKVENVVANRAEKELFEIDQLTKRLLGDSDLVNQILEESILALPRSFTRFSTLLDEGHLDEAKGEIHAMKGMALNASFRRLGSMASEVESNLDEGNPDYLRQMRGQLESILCMSLEAARRYLASVRLENVNNP